MAFEFLFSEPYIMIVKSIALVIGTLILSKIIQRSISKFSERAKMQPHTSKPIERFLKVIIYFIAGMILLGIWGLNAPLSALLTGAGFAGIVIGLATKDIFSDLLSGLMLFFDRPFKIGHIININELWGTVQDIGMRSTKIKTFDGKFVTIPNTMVANSVVTNVSIYEGRRQEIIVGVDYDTDLEKAKKAIETSIKDLQKKGEILEKPTYKIILDEFSNSSINIKALFWYDPKFAKNNDMFLTEIKADLIERIKREFDKQKIIIPFPQVTLSERRKKKV